jgi:hypothetical protein
MATSFEKVWQSSTNNLATAGTSSGKYGVWFIKAFLTGQIGGLTQGLWTLVQSCGRTGYSTTNNSDFAVTGDGSAAIVDNGTGGTWGSVWNGTAEAKLYWDTTNRTSPQFAGTANVTCHSWCVLKSPVMTSGASYYLILDCIGADDGASSVYLCKTMPTGGSVIRRPWSTDDTGFDAFGNAGSIGAGSVVSEVARYGNMWDAFSNRHGASNTAGTVRYHAGLASDGAFWIVSGRTAVGKFDSALIVQEMGDPYLSDPWPAVIYRDCSLTYGISLVVGTLVNSWSPYFKSRQSGSTCVLKAGFVSYSRSTTNIDAFSGGYDTWPAFISGIDSVFTAWVDSAVFLLNTSPMTRRGRLVDISFQLGVAGGTCEPGTPPYASMVAGHVWLPLGTQTVVPAM